MKRLGLILPLLLAAACGGTKEKIAEKPPAFVIDDCAILGAVERDHFKASAGAPVRTKLNGEGVPWTPKCDWNAMGVNLVEQASADAANTVTLNRPRYDSKGVLIRASISKGVSSPEHALCRLHRVEESWKVESCGPDPKDTQPPPPPPSPADQTPDKAIPVPQNVGPTARNPQPIQADPGAASPNQQ